MSREASSIERAGDGLRLGFLINLAGRGAVMVSSAFVSLLIARHYGAETFGRYSVAAAYATMVGTLLDGGFHRLLMREIGRTPEAARTLLLSVVKRRVQIGAVAVPVALGVAALSLRTFRDWLLVALLVSSRLIWDVVATFSSVLLAFERFRLPNLVESGRRILLLATVGALILAGAAVEWIAVATLALCTLGSGAIVRPTLRLVADKTAPPPVTRWTDAALFWLSGVLFWINSEVDQLMLASLSNNYQAGVYAAAVRLIMLCLIIPRAVNDTVVRRWFRAGKEPDQQMATTTLLLVTVGGLLGLQFVIFPHEIITLVFSHRYLDSVPCFAVLGWFLVFNFARCAPSWFISTSDRVQLSTIYLAIAAVANLLANLWLIPRYGALGAAYSTAACELLLLILAWGTVIRSAPKLVLAGFLGVLAPLLAAGVSLVLRPYLAWYLASLGGVCFAAGGVVLAARSAAGSDWLARNWFGRRQTPP